MMLKEDTICEVVAVFDDRDALERALEDLESNGFDRSRLTLLASRETVERELGEPPTDTCAMIGGPSPETPGVGDAMSMLVGAPAAIVGTPAAALAPSGGVLGGIAVAALPVSALDDAGGDGALGSLLAQILSHRVASYFGHQVERGGMLLWISLPHREREATAREILGRHSGHEVGAHTFALTRQARPTGTSSATTGR